MNMFWHEKLYRTDPVMTELKQYSVTVCGAGALGGNLTENLARTGFGRLKLIDRDRIEERNLATQPYYRSDVGAFKAKILANHLYRAIGTPVSLETKELTSANVVQLLQDSQLIVDTFDNSASRQLLKTYADQTGIPCLHAGLAADYAEVVWNPVYRVPSDRNDDVCDYALARNLVLLTVAVACEALITFITTAQQRNFTLTLKDLSIEEWTF
uniref:UBA/THIF-type NAD/FAD binding protein n=1 Tax=Cyanothece sp. (strain PCC 7425 / ATCC 29141) TaxID=395961 RepID=B8HV35_CYAP4